MNQSWRAAARWALVYGFAALRVKPSKQAVMYNLTAAQLQTEQQIKRREAQNAPLAHTKMLARRVTRYPLTLPTVNPPTIYFCNERYTTATGTAIISAMAVKCDHGVWPAYCPTMP